MLKTFVASVGRHMAHHRLHFLHSGNSRRPCRIQGWSLDISFLPYK